MGEFERLMIECDALKQRLVDLRNQPVDQTQINIRKIQIAYLRQKLTRIGHRLAHLSIYRNRKNEND